jgi:biopolymer transport protein ExbD/biopolymer transport protein TolR
MLHFGRRRRRGLPVNAEINLVNLVDVAFVLLIIFMITAPILQGGIEVQLPEADSKPLESSDAVTISVARDGSIFIDRTRVKSLEEFETVLPALLGNGQRRQVVLRGDRGVEFGRVAQVLGLMMRLDVADVGLSVEPIRRQ